MPPGTSRATTEGKTMVEFTQVWLCTDCSATVENGGGDMEQYAAEHYSADAPSFYVSAHPASAHGLPLNRLDAPVFAGLRMDEHRCGLERVSERAARRYLDLVCDTDTLGWTCDRLELSHLDCDGCGCGLQGDRLAYLMEV